MPESPVDLTAAEPLEIVESADDPSTDPLRLEFTTYPASDGDGAGADLPHEPWIADLGDEHVNPKWEEYFEVVAGEYRIVSEEFETTLTAGESKVIPRGLPHRHWNPADRPGRIRYEARPSHRGSEVFETMFTLAQAGRTNDDGMPNPLQLAVIQDAHPDLFYSTDVPKRVQQVVTTVLAPIGRGLGYEASYTRDQIDELR